MQSIIRKRQIKQTPSLTILVGGGNIGQTIDAVQDSVIGPHAPALVILDRLLGRMDEWLLAQLITSWRRNVWNVAIQLLESSDDGLREAICQEQERRVTEWGKRLIDAF